MSLLYKLTRKPANIDDLNLEIKKRGINEVRIVFVDRWTSNFDGPVKFREARIKAGDSLDFKLGDFDFTTVPSVEGRRFDFRLHQRMLEARMVDAGLYLAQRGIGVTVAGQELFEFVGQRFPEKTTSHNQKER